MLELKIDPEFRDKIPPLTDTEFKQLEENILADGEIIEPIIVWNDVIVDGHNRWKIYQSHKDKLPEPKIKDKGFTDRYEAILWMCKNQAGRRSLDADTLKDLIGDAYDAYVKHHNQYVHRNQYEKVEGGPKGHLAKKDKNPKTRPKIAEIFNVSEKVVRDSVERKRGIEKATTISPDFRDKVRSKEIKASTSELANLRKLEGEELEKEVHRIEQGIRPTPQHRQPKEDTSNIPKIREIIASQSGMVSEHTSRTGETFLREITFNIDQMRQSLLRIIGDYEYEDWNNDGWINDLDVHPIALQGSIPLVNFGLTLSGQWHGLDFNVLFQGASRRFVTPGEFMYQPLWANTNAISQFMDRWHPTEVNANPYDPATQWTPGTYAFTGSNPNQNSLFNVQDARYVRLKNVEVGYSLPKKWLKPIHMQSLRVYVSAYNLLTISPLKYQDPEFLSSSSYGYNYPINKTVTLGLNVKF